MIQEFTIFKAICFEIAIFSNEPLTYLTPEKFDCIMYASISVTENKKSNDFRFLNDITDN